MMERSKNRLTPEAKEIDQKRRLKNVKKRYYKGLDGVWVFPFDVTSEELEELRRICNR